MVGDDILKFIIVYDLLVLKELPMGKVNVSNSAKKYFSRI
jgi:hypothetical protein